MRTEKRDLRSGLVRTAPRNSRSVFGNTDSLNGAVPLEIMGVSCHARN